MALDWREIVIGVFLDPRRALDAVAALKDAGFDADDVGMLVPDPNAAGETREVSGVGAGVGTGTVAGGVLGGLAGWLVGISALMIPGVGPLVGAGMLGATAAGAAVGASAGSIADLLTDMGVPDDAAHRYEGAVRRGGALVSVRAGDRYVEAENILARFGAVAAESADFGR
jgi:hypothetical protein